MLLPRSDPWLTNGIFLKGVLSQKVLTFVALVVMRQGLLSSKSHQHSNRLRLDIVGGEKCLQDPEFGIFGVFRQLLVNLLLQ